MQTLTILGSTGSIGVNTLNVVAQHADALTVFALTAHSQITLLAEQCADFSPRFAVITSESNRATLQAELDRRGCKTEILIGEQALKDVACDAQVDSVMAAIVGAAGLPATFAAVQAGKKILLANKESLVMSGGLFMREAQRTGALIMPIDSEHNAIFQCLPANNHSLDSNGVAKILLTGSGGPFLHFPPGSLQKVTPEQACAHPNWSMGKKISVDSATMMNKGLEFIEACWLFNAKPSQIDVVIHPQSIVHSMVQYIDGSVIAQLGQPDMRTPIAYCLSWPQRIKSGVAPLDFTQLGDLAFQAPDQAKFPALQLAINAMESGGDYSIALNAANEIAVDAFLRGVISYTAIAETIAQILSEWEPSEPTSIDDVLQADSRARTLTKELLVC